MDDRELRQLERDVQRNQFKLESLDDWRKTVDNRLHDLEHGLDSLVDEKQIADAVAKSLTTKHAIVMTRWQKIGLGAFAIASPIVSALIVQALEGRL